MKLVTAMSTAALVLAPTVGLAQDPGAGKQTEPGLVEKVIGTITGHPANTKEEANAKKEEAEAKSGDQDSAAKSGGDTSYPGMEAVKKTDK